MQSGRRRWWTFAVSTLAALLVLAASVSLLFRLAVEAVPGYRLKLQDWVTQAVGVPVRIAAVGLTWRGLRPSLDLSDVALLDAGGTPRLQLKRLRLGFGLGHLLAADFMPSTAEIYGLQFAVEIDAQGHWTLHGLGLSSAGGAPFSQQAGHFERLAVYDAQVLLRAPLLGEAPLRFDLDQAILQRAGTVTRLRARIRPPASLAGVAQLAADVGGDWGEPQSWQGEWSATLDGLRGWPGLERHLAAGVRLKLSDARMQASGRIESGRFDRIEAQLQVAAAEALHGATVRAQVAPLVVSVLARPDASGWQVELRRLALGAGALRAPTRGILHFAPRPQGYALDAQLEAVPLSALAPWLAVWKVPAEAGARVADLRGEMPELTLHYEHAASAADRYSLRARLAGAGLASSADENGLADLDAWLTADQDGGALTLDRSALTLRLPHWFAHPLPIEALSGELDWQHDAQGWRLSAPQFEWHALDSRGRGTMTLWLPSDASRSPELSLQSDFAADSVAPFESNLPLTWGAKTRAWLARSLHEARVTAGHLDVAGPLADFPYVEQADGRWALDLAVTDAALDYAPRWPPLQRLQALLKFRGHGLQIDARGAQFGGLTLDRAQAQIPDFRTPQLAVDGRVHGDAARYYAVLRASPLADRLSGLLQQTDASGPAAAKLHLQLPLDQDDPPVTATGEVQLEGLTVRVRGIDPPVQALTGTLRFGDQGVDADALEASLDRTALTASIHPEPHSPDGVLSVAFTAPVAPDDGLFAAYVPDFLRARLSGAADWRARLPFSGPQAGILTLESDLLGLSSGLPPPLDKSAAEPLPLQVTVNGRGSGAPLMVKIDADDRAHLTLRFARAGETAELRAADVLLGAGAAPEAKNDGIYVSGAPETFEPLPWLALLDRLPASGSALTFRGADLTPQELRIGRAALRPAHLQVAPAPGGLSILLDGEGAQGRIDWQRATASDPGLIRAQLARLAFRPLAAANEAAAAETAPSPAEPFDPRRAPLLDLSCAALEIGDVDLGRFVFKSARIPDGQALETFSLDHGDLIATAHGAWHRGGGNSSAQFDFDFRSPKVGAVLRAFGYAPNLEAQRSRFEGALSWPQNPDGLALAQAQGTVRLEVEKGTLRAVEPGAGRVLGLLNLYALPRRLTFDFRDVVSKGLSFDTLTGSFKLADGQAQTDDLEIVAPSMKMEMRGRIGLATRDYDQHVTVYPDVSTAVTVGATLLGGPIGGGVALLAQEIFNKPFSKLSRFSYHVTGSWDNPQIKPAAVQPAPSGESSAPLPAGS
ncbi:MAG: TIGR02099 family protein [Nevskia sp.]|nr:TIGR02099 family protein [Nevskia sp.]